jgi:isoquinoline 1-oxidoreductase subunit alpha
MTMQLRINGKTRAYEGDPDMPLLWVLRDELGLKGTKFGCGMGLCGACTVHLDGEPARACVTSVAAASKAAITTIEGISADGSHPVQKVWAEMDVPQCGYCQAGQIMSACALLKKMATCAGAGRISGFARRCMRRQSGFQKDPNFDRLTLFYRYSLVP